MYHESVSELGTADRPIDVVVVGAGAVGLHLGSQLAQRGKRALVVEAGDKFLGNFDADTYRCVGRDHEGIRLARGRTVGGTTNLWGGQLVEFHPSDLDGRASIPGSAWPVSFDELAPYYPPTYEAMGISTELFTDPPVWQGVSTPAPELGDDLEVFLTRWMKTPAFGELFAQQIESDTNFGLLTAHPAVGFDFDGPRVTAVRVKDAAGKDHAIPAGAVVMAAGVIENVRLMLHAAEQAGPDVPWSGNDNLGRYFQDHLGGRLGTVQPNNRKAFYRSFANILHAGHKFQPKIRMRDAVLQREQTLNVQGIFAFESSASEHLVFFKQFLRAALFSRKVSGIKDLWRHGVGGVRYLVPLMWKYITEHRIFIPSSASIFLTLQAEQESLPDSRITIDPSRRDKLGLPQVVLDWRLGQRELPAIKAFAIRVRDALHAAGIAEVTLNEGLLNEDPKYLDALWDTYHQAGGAIMGTSTDDGVVDRDCKVFGTDNFYVGGSSVFRTASSANVTFTALAFTTRLAEHLAKS